MTDPTPTPDAPAPGLPIGGWAPGKYIHNCHDCDRQFIGAKRSWQCRDCAVQQAALRAERDEAQPVAWNVGSIERLCFHVFKAEAAAREHCEAVKSICHDWYRVEPLYTHPAATSPGADNRICAICDGGPGNEGACGCGAKAWTTTGPGAAGDADLEEARHTIQAQSDQIDTLLFRLDAEEGQATGWECRDYADGWIKFDTAAAAKAYQAETGALMRVTYRALPAGFVSVNCDPPAASIGEPSRCPECGYTLADCSFHMDHDLCPGTGPEGWVRTAPPARRGNRSKPAPAAEQGARERTLEAALREARRVVEAHAHEWPVQGEGILAQIDAALRSQP